MSTSSPQSQEYSHRLLYDPVQEAAKNKTLRSVQTLRQQYHSLTQNSDAMDDLKAFRHRLDRGIKKLEASWKSTDTKMFKKLDSEDGSGDRSAIIEVGEIGVERSWTSIEEWVGHVNNATGIPCE
jgi:hypothetical protein